MTTKPPKYDLAVGTRFLDSRGDVWEVIELLRHWSTSNNLLAKHTDGGTDLFTRATGKQVGFDNYIVRTDPATIDKHIADAEAARLAKEQQESAEREAEERAQAEHEATPLHQLAERIANIKPFNWDWCDGWEALGMDLLLAIEKRLVGLGKIK